MERRFKSDNLVAHSHNVSLTRQVIATLTVNIYTAIHRNYLAQLLHDTPVHMDYLIPKSGMRFAIQYNYLQLFENTSRAHELYIKQSKSHKNCHKQ